MKIVLVCPVRQGVLCMLLGGLLTLFFAPVRVIATQSAASKKLEELSKNYSQQQVAVLEHHDGFLALGDAKPYPIAMDKGRTYYLAAAGCEDAIDIDLNVRDEAGSLNHDNAPGRSARIDFTAPESKTYTVWVKMEKSAPDGAHFSFIVARVPMEVGGASERNPPDPRTSSPSSPLPVAGTAERPPAERPARSNSDPDSKGSPSQAAAPQTSGRSQGAAPASPPPARRPANADIVNLDMLVQGEDGEKVSLRSVMGNSKALYIRVWASWCTFCKQLGPNLTYRANVLRKGDVGVIGLNVYENRDGTGDLGKVRSDRSMPENVPQFVQLDPAAFIGKLKINSVPRTVLINRQGEVLFNGHPRDPRLADGLRSLDVTSFDVEAK